MGTISWDMWAALQRIDPRPIPGNTYMLLSMLAFFKEGNVLKGTYFP